MATLVGALLLLSKLASADAGARLAGRVEGPDGKAIPAASIQIVQKELGFEEIKSTDPKGRFLLLLPDGASVYCLIITSPGFIPQSHWMQFSSGQTTRKIFTLKRVGEAVAAIEIYNQGADVLRAGLFEEAFEFFDAALAVDANLHVARLGRVAVLMNTAKYQLAAQAAAELLEITPHPQGVLLHYEALTHLGRLDQALTQLGALKDMEPKIVSKAIADRGLHLLTPAASFVFLPILERAATGEPDALEIQVLLGYAALSLSDVEYAQRQLVTAQRLDPKNQLVTKLEAALRELAFE